MKHQDVFEKHFYFDESSPTGIRRKRDDVIAGRRVYDTDNTYIWYVCANHKGKIYKWTIARLLYEYYYGFDPLPSQCIAYSDGNKDNLKASNLILLPRKGSNANLYQKELAQTYKDFRNVRLPISSPDYYKQPHEWTDKASLVALEVEKILRQKGISKPPKFGRPRRWK